VPVEQVIQPRRPRPRRAGDDEVRQPHRRCSGLGPACGSRSGSSEPA
jgi:hypothetical protein